MLQDVEAMATTDDVVSVQSEAAEMTRDQQEFSTEKHTGCQRHTHMAEIVT